LIGVLRDRPERCAVAKFVRFIVLVQVLLFGAGHGLGQDLDEWLVADRFMEYITVADPYTQWDTWPGKGKLYPGKQPHGALLTTYLNRIALQSLDRQQPMADGAIIVKENYGPDRRLADITVMYKVQGEDPSAGDWLWIQAGPNGRAQVAGRVKACIGCHQAQRENDYVWTGEVVRGKYRNPVSP
jgi:hypothetical protein